MIDEGTSDEVESHMYRNGKKFLLEINLLGDQKWDSKTVIMKYENI